MESPTAVKNLAEILRLRKETGSPYNLLLTSSLSLTPDLLKTLCGSEDWETFCHWLQQLGLEDRINILQQHMHASQVFDGYRSLAHLLKEGYFSTVLTANVDSFLEEALFEYKLRPTDYQCMVVNRDQDEYIASLLENEPKGIRIIKLRGSLSDRVLPSTFPEFFEFRRSLSEGLKRYVNRDIVIVGSLEREDDLIRALSSQGKKNIYYVKPEPPAYNDPVVKAIRGRGYTTDSRVITGDSGQFEHFFKTLNVTIECARSTPALPDQVLPVQQSQPPIPVKPRENLSSQEGNASEKVERPTSSLEEISGEPGDAPPLSTSHIQKTGDNSLPLQIVRVIIITLAAGAFLGEVSLFLHYTSSLNPVLILPLLAIIATIIFGIMGVLNSDQIVKLFLPVINIVSSLTGGKKEKR